MNFYKMKFRRCSVEGCLSVKRNPNISFFTPPKFLYERWNKAVSEINGVDTLVKFVCADHFLPDDIVTTYSVPQDIAAVYIHIYIKISSTK